MAPRADARPTADGVASRVLTEELAAFSRLAGHDMLGPLNQAASLLALFVGRYRNDLDSDADVLLGHLGTAAARMGTVVAGVRRYLEVASRPLEFRAVDLRVPLSSALGVLDSAIRACGAIISADPLPEADCDGDAIALAFEILIDNAIKFRRTADAPRIDVSAGREGNDIVVAVADNGIGFDPKHREEVALPFRRLNGREYPGAGLGLATAKLIARLHGGGLRIDSAPDAGTTVAIALPGR